MTFAGVIVTYNRKDELELNLIAELNQEKKFDRLYIVDNCSTDGTKDFLEQKGYLDSTIISYYRLDENVGGAGGFYYGVKKAFEDGFDFICLMDDDGRPIDGKTFSVLFHKAKELHTKNKKIMINSLVLSNEKTGELSFGINGMLFEKEVWEHEKDGLYFEYINPFNGTLLSKELIESVGFPNKEFFIRGDEVDYQYRAVKKHAIIATVVASRYYHPSSDLVPVIWKGKKIYVGICPPWKGYYLMRNYVYRIKRDLGFVAATKQFVFQFYITKKCNPDYKNCRGLLIKGYFDCLAGKLGKRVQPGTAK